MGEIAFDIFLTSYCRPNKPSKQVDSVVLFLRGLWTPFIFLIETAWYYAKMRAACLRQKLSANMGVTD